MSTNPIKGNRIFVALWIAVFLGSCTYIQTYDARVTTFDYTLGNGDKCIPFSRTPHIGHIRPTLPNVNLESLSAEDIVDILITHAEKTKDYLDNEALYLQIDILNYNKKCDLDNGTVFQK